MILPIIFLFIQNAFGQVGAGESAVQEFDLMTFLGSDVGTNLAIILFIVGILAVAVIVGRKFSKKKRR